jgi:hypothetical protein
LPRDPAALKSSATEKTIFYHDCSAFGDELKSGSSAPGRASSSKRALTPARIRIFLKAAEQVGW